MTSEVATKLIDEYEGAGHYLQMISAEVKKRAKPVVNKDKIFILDTSRDFEKLKMLLKNDTLRKPGNKSLTAMEWLSYLEPSTGKLLISGREMREKIFAGGVENDIRPIVWQFLLNVHPWDSNESSRAETSKIKTASYNSLVENWKTILKDAFTDDEEVKQGLGNDQGGDEREEGNVVDKLKERKYRIGIFY